VGCPRGTLKSFGRSNGPADRDPDETSMLPRPMNLRNWLPGVLCVATLVEAAPPPVEVVLATGQTPRDAGTARVAELDGGLWDEAGRVLLSGR